MFDSETLIELGYYCAALLFVCTIFSYADRKFGLGCCSIISIISIAFALLMILSPFATIVLFVAFLFIFPAIAWLGFGLGRFVRRKQSGIGSN